MIRRGWGGVLGRFTKRKGNAPMTTPISIPLARVAILTLAEIKHAVETFDRGDLNVFTALDAVEVAVDAYRTAVAADPQRPRREAA